MKADGITLSTVGAGGGANPFLEQLAKQGGGRFYAATNPSSIPDIFLKETQQVSGQQIVEETFFPIQTSSSPILRGLDAGLPAAPRLQRDDHQVGGPERAGHGARRSAPRLTGSTGSAGPSRGRPTRPGAGPRTGSAGAASTGSSASSSAGRSRARRPAASRRPSRRPATTTGLHVESVEPDGSPRDFYSTSASHRRAGPRARDGQPRAGGARRLHGAARRARRRAPTPSGSRRRDRGRRRSGGRSGWSPRPRPSTASWAPTSRSSPPCARPPAAAWSPRATDPWVHDLTGTNRFTELWPLLLVLALLLWPLDIALRRMSLGRRELAGGARLGRRHRSSATGCRPADRDRRGSPGRERSGQLAATPELPCGAPAATPAIEPNAEPAPSRPATPTAAAPTPPAAAGPAPSAPPAPQTPIARPAGAVPDDPDGPSRRDRHDGPPPRRQAPGPRPVAARRRDPARRRPRAAGDSLRGDVLPPPLPTRLRRARRLVTLLVAACNYVETTPAGPHPGRLQRHRHRVRQARPPPRQRRLGRAGLRRQGPPPTAIAFDAQRPGPGDAGPVYLYVVRRSRDLRAPALDHRCVRPDVRHRPADLRIDRAIAVRDRRRRVRGERSSRRRCGTALKRRRDGRSEPGAERTGGRRLRRPAGRGPSGR